MKHLFSIGILCLCATHLSAQKTDEPPSKSGIKYNQHKYEIGIDVKSVFSLQGIGSGLIFKKRIGEKKYISVYEKKALRLQFGGFVHVPVSAKVDANFAGADLREESLKRVEGSVFAGIGLEWQKQRDRIQFFYGGDFSVQFSKLEFTSYNGVYITDQGNYTNVYSDRLSVITTGVNGFGGIRFFLSPRFSIGAESGIFLGYQLEKTNFRFDYYDSSQSVQSLDHESKISAVVWRAQYLRALYFSYYF